MVKETAIVYTHRPQKLTAWRLRTPRHFLRLSFANLARNTQTVPILLTSNSNFLSLVIHFLYVYIAGQKDFKNPL